MSKITSLFQQSKSVFLAVFLTSFLVGATSGAIFGVLGATLLGTTFSKTVERLGLTNESVVSEPAAPLPKGSDEVAADSIVEAVRRVEPAVVSILVTKEVTAASGAPFGNVFDDDFFRQFFGTPRPPSAPTVPERRRVGGGTGFFVSKDGLLVTNKHVVAEETAEYSVLLNDGRELRATVLARDSVNDIAVARVEGSDFPFVAFGDSDTLELGQSVVAVGNALGEFRNTVSVGVISGLSRSVTASGSAFGPEQLSDVIQTDAAINTGNSGGPLANLAGEVVGMNTAVATGGQNIGFAIPSNEVRRVVESVAEFGRVVRPFLGVRYVIVTKEIAEREKLPVNYGALIVRGEDPTAVAVTPGSPADKAGLKENDIILEIGGERVTLERPLVSLINRYRVGDEVPLKVLSGGSDQRLTVTLVERP